MTRIARASSPYLSLFTFAMLMLVTSDNLGQMFFGWEGVGLASYLLIGFWYKKPSATAAAMKAFIVNRVGDFGFVLGICQPSSCLFGAINLDTIFANAASFRSGRRRAARAQIVLNLFGMHLDKAHALTAAPACCSSWARWASRRSSCCTPGCRMPWKARRPFRRSSMPQPWSTAGVFLVARMSPLFELSPDALVVVTVVGAITAFFAATVGLVQNDIKRVIAYSTCSQLGYMFVALGVGAYGAAIFHLFTHAFFKALLFLCAGSVIHAVDGEQDMRYMGGLRAHITVTFWMMTIGTLALTGVGIPFTLDRLRRLLLQGRDHRGPPMPRIRPSASFAFALLVIAALFTSFYSWRLIFMTFFGKPRASHEVMHHVHADRREGHAGAALYPGHRRGPRRRRCSKAASSARGLC